MELDGTSIIIPCYNRLDLTSKCVASLEKLNCPDVEIIIIDNGSTDGTGSFLEKLGGNFICHLNKENTGMVRAFNRGASAGRYETLVFMHNDIIIHDPEWTDKIRRFLASNKHAGILGLYGAKHIRKNGSFMGRGIVYSKHEDNIMRNDCSEVAVVDGVFMAMLKKVYNEIGGLDENYKMHYYDKDISLKAYIKGYRNYTEHPFYSLGCRKRGIKCAISPA